MTATTTRKPVVSTDVFGNVLTLNFITGEELSVDITKLSTEIRTQAMLHGLKQKLVDAAAIARNTDTGMAATPSDKYEAVRAVYDRITKAEGATWNAVREGEAKAQGGMFVRALMELTGKDRELTTQYLDGLSKDQIAALKKHAKVLEIMQRMEREAAATKGAPDSDNLLANLANGIIGKAITIDSALLGDERSTDRNEPAKGKGKGKGK